MARQPLLPEEFVRAYMEAWKNGGSLDDLATKFGMTHSSILAKTGKMRAAGVKLPHLKSAREVDPVKLNAIIQEVMGDAPLSVDEMFNAICADCGNRFFTKTGAKYCVNCIKVHPGERSQAEANRVLRKDNIQGTRDFPDVIEPRKGSRNGPTLVTKLSNPCKNCRRREAQIGGRLEGYCSDRCYKEMFPGVLNLGRPQPR